MNGRRNCGLLAVGAAIVVVGLVWAGAPASSLLVFGLILACPVMMFVMMRGMHEGGGGRDQRDTRLQHRRESNRQDCGR